MLRKPLVLDDAGDTQRLQPGDQIDLANVQDAASATHVDQQLAIVNTNLAAVQNTVNAAAAAEDLLTEVTNRIQEDALLVPKTTTVNGKALTGNITLVKADVGLGNVDNTSDINKPVSTAQATAIALKADQATTYSKTETDSRIQAVVGAAPAALDTLIEIAAQLDLDETAVTALTNTVSTKASTVDLTTETNARIASDDALATALATEVIDRDLAILVEKTRAEAAEVLLVPKTTTVNGKALSSDINLNSTDIGSVDIASIGVPGGLVPLGADGKVAMSYMSDSLHTVKMFNADVTVLNAGTPVYANAPDSVKQAMATAKLTSTVIGLVNGDIAPGAQGDIKESNELVLSTMQWDLVTDGSGGLVFGATYYLSELNPGKLTTIIPATGFYVPIGEALSSTRMLIKTGARIQL